MVQTKSEVSRKYLRWYFSTATQPLETQSRGVSVRLYRAGLLGEHLCQAVLKDISLGGGGVLAPISRELPEQLVMVCDDKTRIKAEVVYRRPVGEKLVFLGLRWQDGNHKERLQLLRRLSKRAYRLSRVKEVLNGDS